MRKITILAVVATLALLGSLMFYNYEVLDGSLRKTRVHTDYPSTNAQCQQACTAAGGSSCGKADQNCCASGGCDEHWYGDYCSQRVVVKGCTSATGS